MDLLPLILLMLMPRAPVRQILLLQTWVLKLAACGWSNQLHQQHQTKQQFFHVPLLPHNSQLVALTSSIPLESTSLSLPQLILQAPQHSLSTSSVLTPLSVLPTLLILLHTITNTHKQLQPTSRIQLTQPIPRIQLTLQTQLMVLPHHTLPMDSQFSWP